MILKFLKDLIAPKKCYICKKTGSFLCLECLLKTSKFSHICYVCKQDSTDFEIHRTCKKNVFYDKVIVLFHYRDIRVKNLIKDSKFHSRKDILEDLAIFLGDLFLSVESLEKKENFIVIPAPMHFFRKLKRGYNQSEILASNLAKYLQVSYNPKIIKKSKHTIQQSHLDKVSRLLNLENAFALNKKFEQELSGKTVILVDDVVSTGTTLNEISKLLKHSGAQKVLALTLASD